MERNRRGIIRGAITRNFVSNVGKKFNLKFPLYLFIPSKFLGRIILIRRFRDNKRNKTNNKVYLVKSLFTALYYIQLLLVVLLLMRN